MQPIKDAVGEFLDEVTAFIEPMLRPGRRNLHYMLVERGDEFECYRLRKEGPALVARGSLDELGRARLPRGVREQPVEFRLDGSRVLTKILHLPAASRSYLDAVVRHQLDRATPWSADKVVFDSTLAEDEPAPEGQISVRLVATSRDVFERSMQRLADAKIKAAVVGTSEDPVDRPSAVNLMHSDRSERRIALRRKVSMALLAFLSVGVFLGVATGLWLYVLQGRAADLQTETDTLRARIEAARSGTDLAASRGRMIARKREAIPAIVLLDRLSAVVPENTYLTNLSVERGEVEIAGLTDDAPALIGILEAADILSNVRFVAPTMRDEAAGRDRFELAAAIAPQAAE